MMIENRALDFVRVKLYLLWRKKGIAKMCLAMPMRVISRDNDRGLVEAGGMQYEVSFRLLPETQTGDYVIVHAGFAIQKLDVDDAAETLRLFEEMETGPDGAGAE